jgi:hypothetical protein
MGAHWRYLGGLAALMALLALMPGGVRAAPEHKPDPAPAGAPESKPEEKSAAKPAPGVVVTDRGLFREEYRRAGAFKFYDNTEDILRTGQFELAYARYVYLKGNLRGQAVYRGLDAVVNQRLAFLAGQLKLPGQVASVPTRRVKKIRRKPAPPACPPAASTPAAPAAATQTGPPSPASSGEKTAIPGKEEKETLKEEIKEDQPKKEESPPPKPSFWEKLKRKAWFWKKSESE